MNADAAQTLSQVEDLRRRTRTRARAYAGSWFPVAVLAALLLAGIALYQAPFTDPFQARYGPSGQQWAGLPTPQRDARLSYAFWFLAGRPRSR